VVVVSEGRGEITLMQGQDMRRVSTPEELLECLKGTADRASVPRRRLREILFGNAGLKLAAVGLATLYWTFSFLPIGTSIRAVLVPVEFTNIPSGMEIEEQSAAAAYSGRTEGASSATPRFRRVAGRAPVRLPAKC